MGAFSFMPDPTADAFTPDQFMEQAYDQPFSRQTTFAGNIGQAALETPGLGTVLKNFTIDEGRRKIARGYRAYGKGMAPDLTPETDEEVLARGDQPLTVEQYKASPSFRPEIPYDQSMTAARAAALAEYSDRKAVVAEMARKRPITALIGSFAGSALDPINYIPIFGEASAGAAIGARVVRSAADAAANVGIAGLLSAPERARYGDDVSFSAQVSQIAMGAAVGGAFGAIGGILHQRGLARDARALAIAKDLEARLATIDNGQKAMATMAEAVDHLKNDGEIHLGEGSMDRIEALHDQTAAALPESSARIAETPEGYAGRLLAVSMPDEVRTLAQHDAAIAENAKAVDAIKTELQDPRFDVVRQADQQGRELDMQRQELAAKMEATRGADQRAQLAQKIKAIEARIDEVTGKVDTATSDRFGALNRELATRTKEVKAIEKERAPVASKVETARQQFIAEHAALPKPEPVTAPSRPQPAPRPSRAVLATKPKPETVPPEAVKASKEVGKPETPKAIAEAHAVDPETGAFPEQFELAQVEKEGRMTAEDTRAMEAANENFDTAKSWGEALRAAAACLI